MNGHEKGGGPGPWGIWEEMRWGGGGEGGGGGGADFQRQPLMQAILWEHKIVGSRLGLVKLNLGGWDGRGVVGDLTNVISL